MMLWANVNCCNDDGTLFFDTYDILRCGEAVLDPVDNDIWCKSKKWTILDSGASTTTPRDSRKSKCDKHTCVRGKKWFQEPIYVNYYYYCKSSSEGIKSTIYKENKWCVYYFISHVVQNIHGLPSNRRRDPPTLLHDFRDCIFALSNVVVFSAWSSSSSLSSLWSFSSSANLGNETYSNWNFESINSCCCCCVVEWWWVKVTESSGSTLLVVVGFLRGRVEGVVGRMALMISDQSPCQRLLLLLLLLRKAERVSSRMGAILSERQGERGWVLCERERWERTAINLCPPPWLKKGLLLLTLHFLFTTHSVILNGDKVFVFLLFTPFQISSFLFNYYCYLLFYGAVTVTVAVRSRQDLTFSLIFIAYRSILAW